MNRAGNERTGNRMLNIPVKGGAELTEATMAAINSDGYTIADNTTSTIMTQNIEEEAKSDSSLARLAAIHGKIRKGESGFDKYEINGVQKLAAYSPIAGTDGWGMAIPAPPSDFQGATLTSIGITCAMFAISLIAAVAIAYWLARNIGHTNTI